MSERLKLVKSFDELRASDFVEVRCDHPGCGRKHAGILLSKTTKSRIDPDGSAHVIEGFPMMVRCTSAVSMSTTFSVSARTVARRIVFKIETGATKADSLEKRRPLERTR